MTELKVDALLIDFSKTFYTLDHSLLLTKLCVFVIEDYFGNYSEIATGVPKGLALGPLLFSIFINDNFTKLIF